MIKNYSLFNTELQGDVFILVYIIILVKGFQNFPLSSVVSFEVCAFKISSWNARYCHGIYFVRHLTRSGIFSGLTATLISIDIALRERRVFVTFIPFKSYVSKPVDVIRNNRVQPFGSLLYVKRLCFKIQNDRKTRDIPLFVPTSVTHWADAQHLIFVSIQINNTQILFLNVRSMSSCFDTGI